MTRNSAYQQALGSSLQANVKQSRVLMVGAGGIGCELLKNLACSGFGEVHVVDLDTIDLSNLNRQFLFRKEHIKKSKALVAKEQAEQFNPNIKIVAYHANIKDAQFNVKWFSTFNLVFNALDNVDARRHVNKMCLAANKPLIESGTTGFNGQVQVIKKGTTACYDCQVKEAPKSFPVCTIRSTPSQPIHCIVWGKSYLLNEIFGESEDESAFDHSQDQDNLAEIEELAKEAAALKAIRQAVGTDAFPKLLFDKVFNADITRLRSIEDMWKSRRPPEPLSYEDLCVRSSEAVVTATSALVKDGQKVWTVEENFLVFLDSLQRLSNRVLDARTKQNGNANGSGGDSIITFDKDDEDTLDFVAASANLRSALFGIERKSRFDIKQMAGNIIPAIATTNAIVAGLCVLEAYKVIRDDWKHVKEVYVAPFGTVRRLQSSVPREPEQACPACGVYHVSASVDFETATLGDLVAFVQNHLGFGEEREFAVNRDTDLLCDPDETELLEKKFSEIGVTPDTFLTISDENDEPYVPILINLISTCEPTDKPITGIALADKLEIPLRSQQPEPETNGVTTNGHAETPHGVKRAREDETGELPAKKMKAMALKAEDVIIIEDDSGAIVLDDD